MIHLLFSKWLGQRIVLRGYDTERVRLFGEKKHLILKRKLYGFSSVIVLHSTGFASAFNQNGTAMQSILKVFYELFFFLKTIRNSAGWRNEKSLQSITLPSSICFRLSLGGKGWQIKTHILLSSK